VQALKDLEDSRVELRIDANPVVADRKHPFVSASLYRYVNAWRLLATELEGVAEEVLEELHELRAVTENGRQGLARHHSASLLESHVEIAERGSEDFFEVGRRERRS
jgi:hypothetical protein